MNTVRRNLTLIIIFASLLYCTSSCKKDSNSNPVKIITNLTDSCNGAIDIHSRVSNWPERNWECDSFCGSGCNFSEHTRPYAYVFAFFNQSNPYQIYFLRHPSNSSLFKGCTYDFCNDQLRCLDTNVVAGDWGSNNLILLNIGSSIYTVKPDFDSMTFRMNSDFVPMDLTFSPANRLIISNSGIFKSVDINNTVYHSFSIPDFADKLGWIDDNHLMYVSHSSGGDSINILDLNSSTSSNVCFIGQGYGSDSTSFRDSIPLVISYNVNNNSIYWTSNHYIFRVNLISKEKVLLRKCFDSIHFIKMDYSALLGKFLLVAEELKHTGPCSGSSDYSLYLMNEDGTDLRRIEIPE